MELVYIIRIFSLFLQTMKMERWACEEKEDAGGLAVSVLHLG